MRNKLNLPLRHILIITFLAQILVAVGLTSYFSWRNGQKTIKALALRLSREVTSHTQKHIDDYLSTPTLFLRINRLFADSQKIDFNDRQDLQQIFWLETQIDPQIHTIYFGSETGDFLEIENQNQPKLSVRNSLTAPYWETYLLDEQGQTKEKLGRKQYDPRQRPWYRAAMEQNGLVWSPVYLFTDPPVLGITSAMPIVDPQTERPQGVIAIDLSLNDISEFLSSLKISDSGRVFIVEKSGAVIATSTKNPLIIKSKNGDERLYYSSSKDRLVRATAKFLNRQFDNLDQIDRPQQLIFKANGDRYFLQTENLNNHPGLDWLIVTVIPESDFIEHIRANIYTTLLLNIIAAVAAAGLGVITSKWIVRSVTNLSRVAQALSKKEIRQIETNPQIKELAVVTECFNSLASELQTTESQYRANVTKTKLLQKANLELDSLVRIDSLTQVYNRYHFDTILAQIWQQGIREQQEIALILCDIDYFKLYNDTYGHPAGDECLRKVAQAIKKTLNRGQDVVARYGGEEFAVILPNTGISGAVYLAEKVRNAIENLQIRHISSVTEDYISLSLGVASSIPNPETQPNDLIQRADRALYRAKLHGRNCVFTE